MYYKCGMFDVSLSLFKSSYAEDDLILYTTETVEQMIPSILGGKSRL